MVEEGLARATEGQAADDCPATGGGAAQYINNLVEPSAASAEEGEDKRGGAGRGSSGAI